MVEFSGLNYLAIIVAWIVTMVIGAWWYSPAGFGKFWSKMSGVDMMKTPKSEANRAIVFVAVSSLLQVATLGLVLHSFAAGNMGGSLTLTLVLWFGFTALTTIGNTLYMRLSLKFWVLNAAYFFVVMMISGFILSVWK